MKNFVKGKIAVISFLALFYSLGTTFSMEIETEVEERPYFNFSRHQERRHKNNTRMGRKRKIYFKDCGKNDMPAKYYRPNSESPQSNHGKQKILKQIQIFDPMLQIEERRPVMLQQVKNNLNNIIFAAQTAIHELSRQVEQEMLLEDNNEEFKLKEFDIQNTKYKNADILLQSLCKYLINIEIEELKVAIQIVNQEFDTDKLALIVKICLGMLNVENTEVLLQIVGNPNTVSISLNGSRVTHKQIVLLMPLMGRLNNIQSIDLRNNPDLPEKLQRFFAI